MGINWISINIAGLDFVSIFFVCVYIWTLIGVYICWILCAYLFVMCHRAPKIRTKKQNHLTYSSVHLVKIQPKLTWQQAPDFVQNHITIDHHSLMLSVSLSNEINWFLTKWLFGVYMYLYCYHHCCALISISPTTPQILLPLLLLLLSLSMCVQNGTKMSA